jgi:hypothetical protein
MRAHRAAKLALAGERLLEAYARRARIIDTHESITAAGGGAQREKPLSHGLI